MRCTKPIILLVSTLILLTCPTYAQVSVPLLKGSVLDREHKALRGVTVSLHQLPDSALVATTLSDTAGVFFFLNVRESSYYVEARTVSYQISRSGKIVLTGKSVTLSPFLLTENPTRLAAVTVKAPSSPLETRDGKLIFNVDKSISASGSNAFDLLKKTPGIGVDQDDNLVLKGSTAVTVLLDGKMTYLNSQQLSILLKSMPAENLSRIEVIATPSSQYDAAGNAGIINIITQKSNKEGWALNAGAGVGTGRYPQTVENIIGNIRTSWFNFFGSYNYDYYKGYTDRSSHRVISNNDIITIFDRKSFEPVETNTHNYKAGLEVYLTPNDELSFVYSGTHHVSDRDARGPTNLEDGSGKPDSVVQNHNITHEPNINNSYTLGYVKKLDTLGKQFSVDADYSRYDNNSSGYLGNQQFTPAGITMGPYQELDFQQPTLITIRAVKTDLTLPFAKIKWTGGLKFSSVTTDNNFVYDSLINGSYVYSSTLSNHFIYDEKIYAAYVSVHGSIGKTVAETGLRFENTLSTGNSITTQLVTKRNYTNLFPYLSLTRGINENNAIGFSVTRRVNRPLYSDLNPFRFFLDKYTYLEGNAYLQPEYAWTGSLNYTLQNTYVATLSYTRTEGAILGFAEQDSATGQLRIMDQNFSHKDALDALLVAPLTIGRKWTVQNTADISWLSYASTEGAQLFRTSKITADLLMVNTFTLPANYIMEVTAHYTSPSLAGVYVNRHYFSVDGGWKKSFLQHKLDVKLAFTDLFRTVRLWGYSVYKDANVSYYHIPDTRRINLSLVYHFGGKVLVKAVNPSEEQERVQ